MTIRMTGNAAGTTWIIRIELILSGWGECRYISLEGCPLGGRGSVKLLIDNANTHRYFAEVEKNTTELTADDLVMLLGNRGLTLEDLL